MQTIRVKDLMVPLEEYAKVSEEATLAQAMEALHDAQERFDKNHYTHRAVLVTEAGTGKVVGKLSQLDVIRSLEPKYELLGEGKAIPKFGFSANFMKTILDVYQLWFEPLEEVCRKAEKIKVKDIMYKLSEGEFVHENAGLNEAVHQLVMGHHQSLLVSQGDTIVGILRLTDVFTKIYQVQKTQCPGNAPQS